MMRWEWREPVNSKVVGPDDKDRDVDRQNPKHENKDRVRVVIEIIMSVRFLNMS